MEMVNKVKKSTSALKVETWPGTMNINRNRLSLYHSPSSSQIVENDPYYVDEVPEDDRYARDDEPSASEFSLQRLNTQFENTVSDPLRLRRFLEFLKKEHATENLNFYIQTLSYLKIKDDAERQRTASLIYKEFLDAEASQPVNVDFPLVEKIRETLEKNQPCSPDLFQGCQSAIQTLILSDAFPRFCATQRRK